MEVNLFTFSSFVIRWIVSILRCSRDSLLIVSSADAYDPLDPTGNITIKWDVMSWTPDGYVVSAAPISLIYFFVVTSSLLFELNCFGLDFYDMLKYIYMCACAPLREK